MPGIDALGLKKTIILLLSFLLVLPSLFFTSQAAEPCQLTFAWAAWKPMQYADEHGKPKGLQIELVEAIARKLNCRLAFVFDNWRGVQKRIEQGAADFTANATPTEDRKRYAYFSEPYRRDAFVIYVRGQDAHRYQNQSLRQLLKGGFRLAVTRGYVYGPELDAIIAEPEYQSSIQFLDVAEEAFELVHQGQLDGFIDDPYIMAFKLRSEKHRYHFVRLPLYFEAYVSAFMFSKKTVSKEFVGRFNAALAAVKQENQVFRNLWFSL